VRHYLLVAVLHDHLATFGTAEDGRLFFSEKGSVVPSSTYYRVWQEARLLALPPTVATSPLASRPYGLRHSALSTWLNAGVDRTEVVAALAPLSGVLTAEQVEQVYSVARHRQAWSRA
jgi:integrase